MANKTVILLDMYRDKCKKVALNSVTKIDGINSLSINMKDRKLTVIGDMDPVEVANLLRKKFRCANLVSGGPVPPLKAPEKPKEEKKEEKKKEEAVTKTIVISPQPMRYPMCEGRCYPPCVACPNRYPRYYKPCFPSEGFYVWK